MKILKIFGIVVGIHVFLLVLVFAIPGCTSTVKPAPTVADTAPKPAAPPPTISVPPAAPGEAGSAAPTLIAFNPDMPAATAPASPSAAANAVRFVPTRPDTPVATTLTAQPVDGVTPATSYTVKSGDNLWTIAKKNNLSVAQLTAANGLATNANLRPGQKIIIPSKAIAPTPAAAKAADAAAAAATMSSVKSSDAMKHTVRSGETLGGIARTYGVKQGDIAVANNISDPAKIRPGMELIIPGWEPSKGAKSGKAPAKSGTAKGAEQKGPGNLTPPPTVDLTPAAPPVAPVVPVIQIGEGTPAPAPKN